jgi:hypothetical protein
MKVAGLFVAMIVVTLQIAWGRQFHVGADARSDGDGSRRHPWRLETALRPPAAVHPGDTVWVHGGVYRGHYVSRLAGAAGKPVIVRCYPGERAVLDGGNLSGSILTVQSSFTWYWGLEIMSSDTVRVSRETGSYPKDVPRGECVTIDQEFNVVGCKFINLVLHDGKLGFNAWSTAIDPEVYGCVIFNNGWLAPDRPHGHNVYAQNETGTKRFAENILTHAFSHNIQIFGSASAYIDNFDLEGNIVSQAGERNVLIGGGRRAMNTVFKSNFLYEPGGGNVFNLGYSEFGSGAENATVTGNYIIGGGLSFRSVTNSKIEDNVIWVSSLSGVSPDRYPANTWYEKRPAGVRVFVRANYYEPGRANIVVFNWDRRGDVKADVSSVLHTGEHYTLLDAENYCGPEVTGGIYTGGYLVISMIERQAATPIGLAVPPRHSPVEFGAFVLIRRP